MPKIVPFGRRVGGRVWFLLIPLLFAVGDTVRERGGASLVPMAMAGGGSSADTDMDGLPDEVEALFLTQPMNGDSDGDGFGDGIEWVHRSDPLDSASVPHLQVCLRSYTYQTDTADARVFSAVWPGNLLLLEQFVVYLGSPKLSGPEGNAALGLMDVTPILPQLIQNVAAQTTQGMTMLSFSFDLPPALLHSLDPLSVGIGARIAGTPVVERMTYKASGSGSLVLFQDPTVQPGSGPSSYWFVPLDPAGGGSSGMYGSGGGPGDPEYCETQLDAGTPTGAGGIVHQIQAAACTPQGFLYCVATDCTALAGQNVTLIDYGFLQTKAKQ